MNITKEKYAEVVKEIRAMLATDECAKCSCPNVRCEWHGDCYNCVRIYRHFGNHVPRCMQFIMDKKAARLKEAVESETRGKPVPPDEYHDYLKVAAPK